MWTQATQLTSRRAALRCLFSKFSKVQFHCRYLSDVASKATTVEDSDELTLVEQIDPVTGSVSFVIGSKVKREQSSDLKRDLADLTQGSDERRPKSSGGASISDQRSMIAAKHKMQQMQRVADASSKHRERAKSIRLDIRKGDLFADILDPAQKRLKKPHTVKHFLKDSHSKMRSLLGHSTNEESEQKQNADSKSPEISEFSKDSSFFSDKLLRSQKEMSEDGVAFDRNATDRQRQQSSEQLTDDSEVGDSISLRSHDGSPIGESQTGQLKASKSQQTSALLRKATDKLELKQAYGLVTASPKTSVRDAVLKDLKRSFPKQKRAYAKDLYLDLFGSDRDRMQPAADGSADLTDNEHFMRRVPEKKLSRIAYKFTKQQLNADRLLEFQNKMRLSNGDFKKVIKRYPFILKLDIDKEVVPRLDALSKSMFPNFDVNRIVARSPVLLSQDTSVWLKRRDRIDKMLGIRRDVLCLATVRQPSLLFNSILITTAPKIRLLVDMVSNKQELTHSFVESPAILKVGWNRLVRVYFLKAKPVPNAWRDEVRIRPPKPKRASDALLDDGEDAHRQWQIHVPSVSWNTRKMAHVFPKYEQFLKEFALRCAKHKKWTDAHVSQLTLDQMEQVIGTYLRQKYQRRNSVSCVRSDGSPDWSKKHEQRSKRRRMVKIRGKDVPIDLA